MHKLLLFSAFLLLLHTTSFGQSGIGEVTAEEDLHISGAGNKVRVDALNATNNPHNLGGTGLYPLMVDELGNTALKPQSNLLVSESVITTPVIVSTQADAALNTENLYQQNFTLQERALVVITYCVGLEFKGYDGASNINDGRVKVAQNYFYLGDGTTENTARAYGHANCTYSNFYCDTATGYVYNSNSIVVTLEAGTHSIHMKGAAFGGGLATDAAFQAIFSTLDRIDISAIYL
ncbi:MAG: hypothetical protein AB8F78_19490 [Saprospiraceae bacterium]